MAHNAPAPSGGGKGGLKTVMGTIVLLIVVLFAISKFNGAEQKAGETLAREGVRPPAQTAPRTETPAETPASDPCAANPAVTVTARPAGTTPEWVSIPMGHCEAVPQTPGIGVSYIRVCLNVRRETDTTGVCPDGAYAVGYQSTSSASVQVTTRFRHNPPRG